MTLMIETNKITQSRNDNENRDKNFDLLIEALFMKNLVLKLGMTTCNRLTEYSIERPSIG